MRPDTVVPSSGALRTTNVPPNAARRSAMFCMPDPSGVRAVEAAPSSAPRSEVRRSDAGERRRSTPSAYFATFCSASSTREVDGRLDVPRVAADAVGVDLDRDGHLAGLRFERLGQTLVGQERRVDPARQVAQVLQRSCRRRGCPGAHRAAAAPPDRRALRPAAPSRPARPTAAAPRRGCCAPAGDAPRPAPSPSVVATIADPRSTGSSPGPGRPARRGRRTACPPRARWDRSAAS